MRKLVAIASGTAALVLGLTGCADTDVPSAGGTSATTPTTPPTSTTTGSTSTGSRTSSSPSTTTSRTLSPSAIPPPPNAGEVTLEGVVEPGVEAGCTLLISQGAQYLLLGGDPAVLRAGQRVIVRGKAEPGVATTCQQGVPFIVAEAKPG
jgi:hypothetical protein